MNGALPLVAGPGTFREARNVCLPLGVARRPQDRLGITSLGASEVTRGSAAAGCRGRRGRGLCLLLQGRATRRVGRQRGARACVSGTAAAVGQWG
jgi:hypothetical protein